MSICLRFFTAIFLVFITISNISAGEIEYLYFEREPSVRIGLSTNARSVSITTADSSLVAVSSNEPNKFLAVNKIYIAPRAYRPPVIEYYRFEIQNIETPTEADDLAKDIREATGKKAVVSLDAATNTWRIQIGDEKETIEEANAIQSRISRKRF